MRGSGPERRNTGRSGPDPPLESAVAELARRQHNVVALRQLCALGMSSSGVRSRVARGRWHRVHAGVYALGHENLTAKGHWMAAVLACGDGAVLSHRSAGALLGLRPDNRATSDVTSRGRAGRQRDGIVAHTGHGLKPADMIVVDGIPCTSVARTLLDLAEVVDRRSLERAIDRAEVLRVLDVAPLEELLSCSNGRRGAAVIRAVLAEHYAASTLTESELEELFLAICRTAPISPPEVNAWVALDGGTGVRADFLWREQRLIVETDGRDVHATRQAFERDRERDQRLMVAGWRVVRFTWRQVTREPRRVAATLRALLAQTEAVG